MHVYFLDIVKRLWKEGDIDTETHLEEYCKNYFPSAWEKAADCYRDYFKYAIRYGIIPLMQQVTNIITIRQKDYRTLDKVK